MYTFAELDYEKPTMTRMFLKIFASHTSIQLCKIAHIGEIYAYLTWNANILQKIRFHRSFPLIVAWEKRNENFPGSQTLPSLYDIITMNQKGVKI